MRPLQQIDFVLFYFQTKSLIGGNWTYQDVWDYAKKEKIGFTDQTRLVSILKLLVEDGFINPIVSGGEPAGYHISFKGLLFEGYENEKLVTDLQKRKMVLQEEEFADQRRSNHLLSVMNTRLQTRMTCLTGILAFGTSIAAIYYLIEILKYLGWIPKGLVCS